MGLMPYSACAAFPLHNGQTLAVYTDIHLYRTLFIISETYLYFDGAVFGSKAERPLKQQSLSVPIHAASTPSTATR